MKSSLCSRGCVQSWLFHSLLIQSETNGLNPQVLVLVLLCLHTVGKHSYHWGITSPEPQFWLLQNGHERYNSVVECLPSSLRHWVQFPKPGNRKDRRGPWLIVSLSVADKAINDSPQLKVTRHDFLTLWQCKRKTHSEKTKQNNKKNTLNSEFWSVPRQSNTFWKAATASQGSYSALWSWRWTAGTLPCAVARQCLGAQTQKMCCLLCFSSNNALISIWPRCTSRSTMFII